MRTLKSIFTTHINATVLVLALMNLGMTIAGLSLTF